MRTPAAYTACTGKSTNGGYGTSQPLLKTLSLGLTLRQQATTAIRDPVKLRCVYRRIRRANPKFWPSDGVLGNYSGPEVPFADPNPV